MSNDEIAKMIDRLEARMTGIERELKQLRDGLAPIAESNILLRNQVAANAKAPTQRRAADTKADDKAASKKADDKSDKE